jgi:hypothetical protein
VQDERIQANTHTAIITAHAVQTSTPSASSFHD